MHAEGKEVGLRRQEVILIVSALDPSGGAGAVADVKTARALGFYPCLAITAVTFQNTCEVSGVLRLESEAVRSQIRAVAEDLKLSCVKVGACARKEFLEGFDFECIVYDPVIRATVGGELTPVEECVRIAEISSIITPNRYEAELMCRFLSIECGSDAEMAKALSRELGCSVIITGRSDVVCGGGRVEVVEMEHSGVDVHGTGCVYSTALACYLSKTDLFEAARLAREFVSRAAKNPLHVGKCRPVVNV